MKKIFTALKEGILVLWFVKAIRFILSLIPYELRITVVTIPIRIFIALSPKYRHIAHKNLQLVFPDKDEMWRNDIIKKHCRVLANMLVDFFRLPFLDFDWVEKNVDFEAKELLCSVDKRCGDKGFLCLTGHLSSFELLPMIFSSVGCPVSIVVRNLKPKLLDEWWNKCRSVHECGVMSRNGAVRTMIKRIKDDKEVGILFDQNVTRNNAIFVDWFGRPAATTPAFGQLALKLKTPVIVFEIQTKGDGHYYVRGEEVKTDDLMDNSEVPFDEGVRIITERAVKIMERYIKESPENWFWFHKRWRTTPNEGDPENFYK